MKVLVIGSGGREHAIAWKLSESPKVSKVYCAPGNGGTANEKKCENVDIKPLDFERLANFVKENDVYFTIVGPEEPLAKGVSDYFEKRGLKIFGPKKDGAFLEASKAFAKEIMVSAGIPTAYHREFDNFEEALKFLKEKGVPIVIKADGLAAGKGVTVAHNFEDAENALKEIFIDKLFGEAGNRVVIEEFLTGEEASFIAITDGNNILPFASSQDHKTVYDNDTGPNTGGMGAYSPAPIVDQSVYEKVMNKVMYPLLNELQKRKIDYKGFIYAGLMIDNGEPKVLEFNCRLGDPETQPLLFRMKSDFFELIDCAINGDLDEFDITWYDEYSVGVVMASGGYPKEYEKGFKITGLESVSSDVKVFHAGTKFQNGEFITDGGRVLCVTARAADLKTAIDKVYKEVSKINFNKCHYRRDIGLKGLIKNNR
ncbi:phosphoribosylamine--glycine ligase [Calditerrivibrio sp.]|uniref:phosphoribosylamine--glycine ligase n=1 Tax=Calditerrivibrio sp. TaxID=2792612 RepID=UPI003D0E4434